jgi:hypothetical protein
VNRDLFNFLTDKRHSGAPRDDNFHLLSIFSLGSDCKITDFFTWYQQELSINVRVKLIVSPDDYINKHCGYITAGTYLYTKINHFCIFAIGYIRKSTFDSYLASQSSGSTLIKAARQSL